MHNPASNITIFFRYNVPLYKKDIPVGPLSGPFNLNPYTNNHDLCRKEHFVMNPCTILLFLCMGKDRICVDRNHSRTVG